MKKLLLLCGLLVVIGCADSTIEPGSGSVEFTFRVLNSVGYQVRSIEHGKPIHFELVITNGTDETITVETGERRPAAAFYLEGETHSFGHVNRLDSRAPRDSVFILHPRESLRHTVAWSLNPWNAPPPVGEYIAHADVSAEIDGREPEGHLTQELSVVPPEAGAQEVFAWYRTPAFGFCPPANRIYWASVMRYAGGRHVLRGTIAFDNSILTMPCGPPDYCIAQQPFEDVVLTEEQEDELYDLLNSFPDEEHVIDPACDPCRIDYYYLRGREKEINPCASGSELFWMKVAEIDTFLHQVAGLE